jgi:hypothetical protein
MMLHKIALAAALASGYGLAVVRDSRRDEGEGDWYVPPSAAAPTRKPDMGKPISPHPAMPGTGWPETRQQRRHRQMKER